MIATGYSSDTIYSTDIENDAQILTGDGNDVITGEGQLDNDFGAIIDTGMGDDKIIFNQSAKSKYRSIWNDGLIITGGGNDIVDALRGGFYGDTEGTPSGEVKLGDGEDTLIGFGTGGFFGGNGTDKILFGEGAYIIGEMNIISNGMKMRVQGFERIGGVNGGLFDYTSGTLIIDKAGIGTFDKSTTSNDKEGDIVINIGDGNTIGDININVGNGGVSSGEWTGKVFFDLPSSATILDITKKWFGSINTSRTKAQTLDIDSDPQLLDVATKTWSKKVKVNKIVQASNNGDTITAEAPEKFVPAIGSVLTGGKSKDIVQGRTGWDVIDGSDFIHGGNGRDVITGGVGGDELWGDFGLNTFKSEKDGQKDLVVIKSDHYVYNWYNDSYTNNPNGERTDFIEGLETWDRIRVTGGYKQDLRFAENVTHMGQTGIAIYLKDSLEALYTGNDLSLDQIKNMTDGDGSDAALANAVHQYGLDWL